MKRGFTLVELLIVIGIIAILAATLMGVSGGSSESARAAKCMANLRSLAQAANSAAMSGGFYPRATSYQSHGLSDRRLAYQEVGGWISWLSNTGDPFGHESGKAPTSPVSVKSSQYDEKNEENARFSLTNGTLWVAVNRNESLYTCPTHANRFQKKNGYLPRWSYVMNAKFGYDYTKGSKGVAFPGIGYGSLGRADRTLMFAELPLYDPLTGKEVEVSGGDAYQKDSALQYKGSVGGETYGKLWDGKSESIGFVHKANKGRYCGHVAFADGHVEKLLGPKAAGGITIEQLTILLCEGKDYVFDGKGYDYVDDK